MRWLLPIPVLVACAGGPDVAGVLESEPQLRTWLEGTAGGKGGLLVVQGELDQGLDGLDVPTPAAEGLDFALTGPPEVEQLGERTVVTWRWRFTGPAGSYEIPPVELAVTGEDGEPTALASRPLFVDLAVEPPRPGEIADIVDPPAVWEIPWALLTGTCATGMLFLGGLYLGFRYTTRRAPPALPPEPPDVAAIRRWEAIRADGTLDDFAKALALSQIFRAYAEAVLGFPATAWTTSEILEKLDGMEHLPTGNVPRARRLLRATDRVKYAEVRPGRDFFDDLDADLRAFVGSTRPHRWEGDQA